MSRQMKIRGLSTRLMLKALAVVFRTRFKPKETVMVAGKSRTAESLARDLEQAEQHFARVDQARAHFHKTVEERAEALVGPIQLGRDAVVALEVHWGSDPEKLADAGIPPKKAKRQLTAKEKVAAAEKAQITRRLRGTKGKRQKQELKATGKVDVTTTHVEGGAPQPTAPASETNTVVPAPHDTNPVTA